MIDRYTVQRILDTAQIVDVVSDFVSLKRAGANFKGLCPFHDDKTPSFMVSPAKNYCKCFACGKGGSPVGFIMEHEQLTYPDALRYLAKKYNIEVKEKEQTEEEKLAISERESMFVLNEYALNWFENQLYETSEGTSIGMAYFRHRGFRDDIIRKFRLGFSPSVRNALSSDALSKGYSKELLLKTGLSYENQHNGNLTDRFAGRVIFPIFTVSGKICGFGGRVLDAATKGVNVKYQNSPESAVYSKKNELYGLFQAKNAIAKNNTCYLVEGYTDVMAMHQMGVENVVASSGTALTVQQIALIHRLTQNIIVVYDGDAAGIKASQRGIDLLLEAGMNVRLLLLPDGDDPDSFSRKCTAQKYQDYIKSHIVDFISFKTNLLIDEANNDPIKMSELVTNIVQSISKIPNAITRTTYIRQASQQLAMPEQLVASSVVKYLQTKGTTATKDVASDIKPDEQGKESPNEISPITSSIELECERQLAKVLVMYGDKDLCSLEDENGSERVVSVAEYIMLALQHDDIAFSNSDFQKILIDSYDNIKNLRQQSMSFFLNHVDNNISKLAFDLATNNEQLSKYHSRLGNIQNDEERLMDIVSALINHFKLAVVDRKLKVIIRELSNSKKDKTASNDIMQRYMQLKQVQSALAKECGDRVLC